MKIKDLLDPYINEEISKNEDSRIRYDIAYNLNTSPEVLRDLASDEYRLTYN